jgi:salicylate hydroxylase
LLHRIGPGEALNEISEDANGVWVTFRRFDTGAEVATVTKDNTINMRNAPIQRAEFLDILLADIEERRAAGLFTKKCSRK